ncbi:MAG: hypothetical protein ACLFSU_03425 [Acholeplasmataceae bacterium]
MVMVLGIYFLVVSIVVTCFQVAIFFGAPLGAYTLGGKYPGVLPKDKRILALIQVVVLWGFVYIVLVESNILGSGVETVGSVGIWFVVVFFLLGSIANLTSQSKPERLLWGPVNVLTFLAVLLIAVL